MFLVQDSLLTEAYKGASSESYGYLLIDLKLQHLIIFDYVRIYSKVNFYLLHPEKNNTQMTID